MQAGKVCCRAFHLKNERGPGKGPLFHFPHLLEYSPFRSEVGCHSPGLLKEFEDLTLPTQMGLTEQYATLAP